jgi:hypothetical protein
MIYLATVYQKLKILLKGLEFIFKIKENYGKKHFNYRWNQLDSSFYSRTRR